MSKNTKMIITKLMEIHATLGVKTNNKKQILLLNLKAIYNYIKLHIYDILQVIIAF